MRCGWVLAILCLGCSTSAKNDEQNSTGGTDASTDGGGAGGSAGGSGAATGGSAGATGGAGGATGGTAGAGGTQDSGTGGASCTTTAVVINEVSTIGANGTDEFIELHNPMGSAFNLDGYQIQIAGRGGIPVTAWLGDPTDEILAGGFFVVAGAGFTLPANGLFSSGQSIPGEGGVALLDQSTILDSVAFGGVDVGHPFLEGAPAKNDGADGTSMARLPNGEDCNDNATDFAVSPRTPGSSNEP